MKKIIFVILSLLLSVSLMAQTKTITGKIVDSKGEGMIGANVIELGTTNGTVVMELDGKFSLNVKENAQIQIVFIGYITQTLSAQGRNYFDVVLVEDSETLEEVVVTGYGGKQLRSKVTNSIAKVKEETFKVGIFSNPAQALSGTVAGLSVTQTSGNPGATPTVTLRGGTDFGGSGSPLIILDGQARGSMSDINPEDIESMEVLKDAGATAIYGARANNGVILITSKRGKDGHSEINFKAKAGLNFYTDSYQFMEAGDYIHWMRLAYKNSAWANMSSLTGATPYGTGNIYWADAAKTIPANGNLDSRAIWSTMKYSEDLAFLLNQGWQTMTDPVYGDKLIYKNFSIKDFNIVSPALSQDYNINMSGGNDKGKYYAGLGYNHSEGTAVGNWYSRLTFTFNGDYKIKPWLTSASSFSFADATWYGMSPTQTDEANYFSRVLSVPTTFRGYNADGEELLGANSGDGNQRFQLDKFVRDNNTQKFNMGQSFNIDITKGLLLKVSASWLISDGKYESFNKDYMTRPNTWNRARNTSASYSKDISQTYSAILTYDKQINDHSISAMVGTEFFDAFAKGFSASGSGAPTDDFGDLEYVLDEVGKRGMDSWHGGHRIMSYLTRLNYDYQGKYLLSFVMRRDGYSRLAKINRWGNFPGISGGWIFTREDFVKNAQDVLSFGKLRGSFGVNGNVNPGWVGNYTVQGSYGSTSYNSSVGYRLGGIPNPYLTWETSRTIEVGVDLGWFNNMINTNFTYYKRNTYDKFASITVPSTSGITSIASNNGEFSNQGLEFEINYKMPTKKDFNVNIGLVGAYNTNKVVKLPDNGIERNRQGGFEVYTGNGDEKIWVGGLYEGQRPGDLYLHIAEGIYKTQDEIPAGLIDLTTGNNGSNGRALYGGAEGFAKLPANKKSNALQIAPGDVKWKDVNGDGIIDNFDMVKVGNTVPKWTGGINGNFGWKGLSLSYKFDYALGFMAVDWRTPWIMGNMQGTYNTIQDTKQSWTPDNPNAKYPSYVWADQLGKRNYARSSSLFAYKGDYLAFREVTLAYTIPKSIVKKLNISRLDVSVTGQNLGYWTEADHLFSPEQASNWGGYPLPRIVVFGLNLTF